VECDVTVAAGAVEKRFCAAVAMKTISRFPIVFDQLSEDLGGFTEVIRPSAVERALRERTDIVALRNHDSTLPLGRVAAGTLRLFKERRGLRAELDADDSISFVSDTLKLIARGDAPGGSFAFNVIDDVWSLRDGQPFREVLDMGIREVSLAVSFPAYKGTAMARADEGDPARSIEYLKRLHKQRLAKADVDRRIRLAR
jgi:HK97 family phage prohead protease